MNGFHHLRARARATRGLEPFPAHSTFKRVLDRLMYGVGFLASLALLPQIFQIYSSKSSEGVSPLTWLLLTCVNVLWALYGAVHKDTQILFANALIIFFDLIIVVGIFLY